MISNEFQNFQEALAKYNCAIALNPHASDYDNRGLLKAINLQDIEGGLADFDRAIQLEPDNTSAYVNRGILKNELLNDCSGGIADMQQAASLYRQQGNTKDCQMIIDLIADW
jgi:tetratricopeptide (TPR) repeat protein